MLPLATICSRCWHCVLSSKVAPGGWAGSYDVLWLIWQMNHFHLVVCSFWFCFFFFYFVFLAPDRWVGFCNLLNHVITHCLTELVTTQDLGMHGGRTGYFTLSAISLLICLFMLRSLTTAERSVWSSGSGLNWIFFAYGGSEAGTDKA